MEYRVFHTLVAEPVGFAVEATPPLQDVGVGSRVPFWLPNDAGTSAVGYIPHGAATGPAAVAATPTRLPGTLVASAGCATAEPGVDG